MTGHHRRRTVLGLLGGLLFSGAVLTSHIVGIGPVSAAKGGNDPVTPADASTTAAPPVTVVDRGVCDVDGVRVSYGTQYHRTPDPGYRVVTTTVSGLDAHCRDAQVRVTLSGAAPADADPTAGATVLGTTESVVLTLPQAAAPLASWVRNVAVSLAGGTLPVPADCRAERLERSFLGTTGDDAVGSLTGTNQNDVLFGLDGNDAYSTLNGDDCVVAGNGHNRIDLGNGSDVVLAGDGRNVIVGGPGTAKPGDMLRLGDGDNMVDLASTNAIVRVGAGDNTISLGNGPSDVHVAGRAGGMTTISIGNGALRLVVGAGAGRVHLQGGDGSALSLADGNDEIYLLGGKNNVVRPSSGTDTCYASATTRSKNDLRGCDIVRPLT